MTKPGNNRKGNPTMLANRTVGVTDVDWLANQPGMSRTGLPRKLTARLTV